MFNISFAQNDCSCREELGFVVNYYEKNLPGFKDNVTPKTNKYYTLLKNNLLKSSSKVLNETVCFKLLTKYVEFFKDNHSSIRMKFPFVDENDPNQLKAFLASDLYKLREVKTIKTDHINQYPINEISGLYQTKDGTYTIAVFQDKTEFRDYVGVIVHSKTKLWKKGQVKLEFKKKPNSKLFEAFVYMKNHSLRYYHNFTFNDGILGGNWFKTSLKNKTFYGTDVSGVFDYKSLNDSIAYLKIPTFSSDKSAKIDSLYEAAFPDIRKKPYLIIDVRNNGGGNDENASPLLEFIYTNKIQQDTVEVYVTPDNIKVWEQWYEEAKSDPENYSKEDLAWFEDEISKQKQAEPFSFISRSKGGEMTKDFKPNAVKKVAIIFNRYSASSCESLLFWAMQSKKTILVGENSGGYVGYGEIGSVSTPCFKFELGCTMTRYRYQREYEADGIPPKYYLNNKKNWVDQTIDLLNQD